MNTRKASHFTKAQKIQEGVLSEDDIQSPTNPSALNHQSHNPVVFDPIEAEAENFFSEDLLFPFNDENFVLDTTQDLPIRKPQSAYVIFGKLVSSSFLTHNLRPEPRMASASQKSNGNAYRGEITL